MTIAQKWQMVPVEPTDDMVVAFAEAWYSKRQSFDDPDMVDAYRDMLAVAPECPDARLIAAAQTLLEALQRLVQWGQAQKTASNSDFYSLEQARAAIALATLNTNEQGGL